MFNSLRIIFAGTSEFSAYHLNALLSSKHKIVAVFTQPDKPVGRGKKIIPTPVKVLAIKNNLPIFQPNSFHQSYYQQLITDINADILVSVAYGLIIPENILKVPRLGCINIHCSLLPRWRGATPVQHALLAGDVETGVTIIQMDIGLDTGDILHKLSCPISTDDTTQTLYSKLAYLGRQGMIETLQQLANNKIHTIKQDETQATYTKKISKKEARIDWSLTAIQLERCIRAFNPWPISWLEIYHQPVKIWRASVIKSKIQLTPGTIIDINKKGMQVATIENILNLELLQLAGKTIINVQDLLNSNKKWFKINSCLT